MIDESNEHLVNQYNIVSYPTLLLVKEDGSQIPYLSDKREKKDIDLFLKQHNVF
jgi:thioredoxin-related protein